MAAAQGDDGYVNSYYTVAEPGRRWTDLPQGHELYCAGHLVQAAIAYRRATGDDRLLAIARRFVDHIHSVFGPGRRATTDGHAEIEMALVELYRETGERRHLDLAAFFLDQRGRGRIGPNRYDSAAAFQDRVPVREATTVEGHAVRALYLTTGVADVYLETGDAALLQALTRQWRRHGRRQALPHRRRRRRHLAEAFGHPYELPSDLAYSETCGAIASVMWSWRMLLATGQSRFADLIERTLYNAVLAGVSLIGDRYFYVNPLASNGEVEHLHRGGRRARKPWHLVACCPPNVMRLLASLGHYVATHDASGLQIHQYAAARITWRPGGHPPHGDRLPLGRACAAHDRGDERRAVDAGAARARLVHGGDGSGQRPGGSGGGGGRRVSAARARVGTRRRRRARPADARRATWRRTRGSSPRAAAWPSSADRSSTASSRPIIRRCAWLTSRSTRRRR